MIDEKKIEEAANKYLLNVFNENVIGNADFKEYIRAFKSGINWFKENLWHDAREEPERGKILLIKHHQLGVRDPRYLVLNEGANGDWSDTVADYLITRWLYIEDLMKGGE